MTRGYPTLEAQAQEIADDWCRLLDASGRPYPFLHPAWHTVWSQTFPAPTGDDRFLLTVRDGSRLRLVAPLERRGTRLTLAGDHEICDYMDIVADPDADAAAWHRLLDALAAIPWQELVLWGLPEDSLTRQILPRLAAARGWSVEDALEAVCPRVALPASWEEYLASLSKKDRHELRRKLRRFQAAGATLRVETLTQPDAVRAGLDDFIRLHTASRQDKREFMTPQMETFFRAMAVALAGYGLVRLAFVELDGVRVAGLLAFDAGEELLLYNSGYDPALAHASVGIASKALLLREAIAEGRRWFDFLRGAEPYKYDLGGRDYEVHTLTVRRATADGEPVE
jgi:CelD/BcsL family acetyltransferase involved in cellulose biosynthesis